MVKSLDARTFIILILRLDWKNVRILFTAFSKSCYVNTLGTAYGVIICNTENAKEIFCYINVVCKVET